MIDISTADLRKSLGDIFNRVQYAGNSYIVRRKGKAVGAIVPVELAEEIERVQKSRGSARDRLLEMVARHRDSGEKYSDDEAMEIAVEEVDSVRRKDND